VIERLSYQMLMDDMDQIRGKIKDCMMESMASRFEVE
jgi:hypothetical protein